MKSSLLIVALLATMSNAYASCGSSFCSVNTHWDTQGMAGKDNLRIDLRYTYAKADQFRAGTSKIATEAPSGSGEEIENLRTINQLLNLNLDYMVNADWDVALDLPVVMRDHTHTFDAVAPNSAFEQQAKFNELGDARIMGKYRLDSGHQGGSGIMLGMKLPTGATDKTMTPPDPADPSVPYALERSSQPGSGSMDILLGGYYFHEFESSPWGWFASAQFQNAVKTHDEFKPGNTLNLDVGAHYPFSPALTALVQLNTQFKLRDTGLNANPASGGRSVNLSPGLNYSMTPKTNLYGFVQVAVYQYANDDAVVAGSGQLTAPWSFAFGINHSY
jgi:hypothetical protein